MLKKMGSLHHNTEYWERLQRDFSIGTIAPKDKLSYTREELIKICERAFVPQRLWNHADSENSQRVVGRCYQLLKCECNFMIMTAHKNDYTDGLTNKYQIVIKFWVHTDEWFKHGDNPYDFGEFSGFTCDSQQNELLFFLPTPAILDLADGKDWFACMNNDRCQ